jgi:hypothetical protein
MFFRPSPEVEPPPAVSTKNNIERLMCKCICTSADLYSANRLSLKGDCLHVNMGTQRLMLA